MKFSLLLAFCAFWVATGVTAQELPPAATAVFQEAYQQAAKEHKNVFIIFHASWCGWCHRMDSAMDNPACRKFFNDHYVIRHLTVMEAKDKRCWRIRGRLI
jgi:thioredoxin-related protein